MAMTLVARASRNPDCFVDSLIFTIIEMIIASYINKKKKWRKSIEFSLAGQILSNKKGKGIHRSSVIKEGNISSRTANPEAKTFVEPVNFSLTDRIFYFHKIIFPNIKSYQ